MAKLVTIFTCRNCDAQYPKWEGRCHQCGKWGIIESSKESSKFQSEKLEHVDAAEIVDFAEIDSTAYKRVSTGIYEFDRVLGGGIVPGSLVLIAGAPGIGKSTLLLQIIGMVAKTAILTNSDDGMVLNPILYISGEESAAQVKSRFDRLGLSAENIKFANETVTETICAAIVKLKPMLAIIDSIQTLRSNEVPSFAGSLQQVSISCVKLVETAKKFNVPVFIIGHITKEGVAAGPKTLEHLVDTVLYLEGDKNHFYRLLRSVKNRFGSVDEVGIFEMTEKGLIEVKNPSNAFLQNVDLNASGTVAAVIMEGTRPLIIEIQALTSKTYFGYPKRATSGFKKSRLEVLIAILNKRLNLRMSEYDVYLNVAGGLKINEPAADLAAACAIISSFYDRPMPGKTSVFGEIGLGGEVRPVAFFDNRLREADNLGFASVICPIVKTLYKTTKIAVNPIKTLVELNQIIQK